MAAKKKLNNLPKKLEDEISKVLKRNIQRQPVYRRLMVGYISLDHGGGSSIMRVLLVYDVRT